MNEQEQKQIVKIAEELPEWFTKKALENIAKDCINFKTLVEKENKIIIGFIIYSIEKDKCLIKWMAVKKGLQGKGIGRKLINNLILLCKKAKIKEIETDTLAETEEYAPYEKTRSFYYSVGFTKYKVIKRGYEDGDDKLVLKMSLGSLSKGEVKK